MLLKGEGGGGAAHSNLIQLDFFFFILGSFLEWPSCTCVCMSMSQLLGSEAGAAVEALEKAAGAQTRPAHSPTGTALMVGEAGGG